MAASSTSKAPAKRSHQRKEHPMIGVREFRDTFPTITETVKVICSRRPYIEVLGTWTPNPQRSSEQPAEPTA